MIGKNEYKIIAYSKFRYALCLLLPAVIMLPVAIYLARYKYGVAVLVLLCMVFPILGLFVMPRYYAKKIIIILMDNECIEFRYYNEGRKIKWNEIEAYKYEPSYNFDKFELYLKDKKSIRYHRWCFDNQDDFEKYLSHFQAMIDRYNRGIGSVNAILKRERRIFENKMLGAIIYTVSVLSSISIIYAILTKGISFRAIISILMITGPLTWILFNIAKGKKQIRKNECTQKDGLNRHRVQNEGVTQERSSK